MTDDNWMQIALEEAKRAAQRGEIPIGAVAVWGNKLIVQAGNRTISDCDPSAHAEIVLLRAAAQAMGNYRLNNLAVYVTAEPCVMCMGALIQARICKLVFGAYNLRGGACGTDFDLSRHPALNHQIDEVRGGVLKEACSELLQRFFKR